MYLLDSNIFLWWVNTDKKFSKDIHSILADPSNDVFYSVVTPWELSIKNTKGKLPLPKNFFPTLSKQGFSCLAIEESHINTLRTLPKLHGDPFDRMLAAQAKAEKMTLITSDKNLAAYPIKTLLVGT